jgi:hypothetical protein
MEKIPNADNIERLRQEFYDKVDAGDFDDLIKARDVHHQDQFWERVNKMSNPTTPDEFIESVIIDEENKISEQEAAIEEVTGEVKRNQDEIAKRSRNLIDEFQRKAKRLGGTLGMLRQEFKDDPKNFEAYLRGL